MADYHLKLPKITWGAAYANTLTFAHPLEAPVSGSEPRDGFETIRLPSGTEDVWDMPDDYLLRGRVRSIPITDDAYLGATGWDGAAGWRAFLEWARRKNSVRWYPDATQAGFVDCTLVDPMKGQGDVDPDNPYFRSLDLVLRTTAAAFSGY